MLEFLAGAKTGSQAYQEEINAANACQKQTYGQDVLNLVLAKGFLAKLLENQSGTTVSSAAPAGPADGIQAIVDTVSLDQQQLVAAA